MRAAAEHRTVLPGPPTIYQTLLDHPKRGDYDLTSLRFAVTGAATIPVVLIERMQSELDIDIVLTGLRLTEAAVRHDVPRRRRRGHRRHHLWAADRRFRAAHRRAA